MARRGTGVGEGRGGEGRDVVGDDKRFRLVQYCPFRWEASGGKGEEERTQDGKFIEAKPPIRGRHCRAQEVPQCYLWRAQSPFRNLTFSPLSSTPSFTFLTRRPRFLPRCNPSISYTPPKHSYAPFSASPRPSYALSYPHQFDLPFPLELPSGSPWCVLLSSK
jgi:hypothetical protein